MVLQWQIADGGWVGCDVPPALVYGVALIRAGEPAICLFARSGRLYLQVAAKQFGLAERTPHINFGRDLSTAGLRRRFTLESAAGVPLFSHASWSSQGDDFFSWLAVRAARPEWRTAAAANWSQGVDPAALRSS